ncbi:helix-turn-helix domain-containing protein [Solimonas marina]|uniref:Helix-turn-helix transcriptional regulator n=1 Tax=Solimonas marina TaxID=2714601 RepID=A0A969WBH6_9GAMM|nr:helix-turn-helix transcriptional regulator [Solimonas marina]NKF23907.1 helix-turn-helix transcriptional regulator [Solimonas marina]
MSDIATLLKSEISRLSRKTLRQAIAPLQSATASHRKQIASMKRQIGDLERELKKLRRAAENKASEPLPEAGVKLRFVAKGLKSMRTRLGISAEELGQLIGASSQSVYNWESKKTTPRAAQVEAIAQLRGLGKKEARARLEAMEAAKAPAKATKKRARKKAKTATPAADAS